MDRPLVLVAASGLAQEAAEAATRAGYRVVGCVDDDPGRWGSLAGGWLPVLGGLEELDRHPDAEVLLCAGRGSTRELLEGRLRPRQPRYATVVDPSVAVPASCDVGSGSIILAGCVFTASARVGEHAVLMPHVTITHDDVVEDFATLAAAVALGGGVHVGRGAYLGMASSVRERVIVGDRTTVGMGAVVLTDVPAGETWYGVPARRASDVSGSVHERQ